MSADAERREQWAASFEAQGASALRCVGPEISCALVAGCARCPLLEESELAIYDVASLSPAFLLRLLRYSPRLQLGFARDVVDADGRHHPIVERVSRADDPIHLRL